MSAETVLLFGRQGQLGTELARCFADHRVVAVDMKEVDFASPASIRTIVRQLKPAIILNAAAYTAVDRAEEEPLVAMTINGEAPGVLAEEASSLGSLLVHYSTDYVFDGSKQSAWVEEDSPAPLNEYGKSKLAGERAVIFRGGKYLIFRTSWVFGPVGQNFLLTMLRLGLERSELSVVDDQVGAPTSASALAEATRAVLEKIVRGEAGESDNWAGLYHMTCKGEASWCRFARAILTRAYGDAWNEKVKAISSDAYPTRALRPRNSILSNQKLQDRFGVGLPSWETALDLTLRKIQQQAESGSG